MRLQELAERLGCELLGDGGIDVTGVAPIESAGPSEITFLANPRYRRRLRTTEAAAVIVGFDAPAAAVATLRTSDPYRVFALAIEIFHRPLERPSGIHPTAVVADSARIGPDASIGPYAVVGERVHIGAGATLGPHVVIYPEARIGDRFTAYANVTVRERVRIGDGVILHSGAVIGSDGFGYVLGGSGVRKIVQSGIVVLEDDVEIGANTTIDRAAVGATFVRRGAKIDNLVMIAHGCEIGEGSMLAGQAGLSGSTRLGRNVRMGGQAGSAGHLTIGEGAQVAAQTGVTNSIPAGAVVAGTPEVDMKTWRRVVVALTRLPEMLRRVRAIERRLGIDPGAAERP